LRKSCLLLSLLTSICSLGYFEDAISTMMHTQEHIPSRIAMNPYNRYFLAYSDPYVGIGDPLNIGHTSYSRHFRAFSSGISLNYFQTDMFISGSAGLSFSKKLGKFSFGVKPIMIFESYRKNNFHYVDDDIREDPVFGDGNSNMDFTLDFGISWKPYEKFIFDLYTGNILDPDLSLSSSDNSNNGREFGINVTYHLWKHLSLLAYSGYNTETPNDESFLYGFGLATNRIHENLIVTGGLSNNETALGLKFKLPIDLPLNFEYIFSYPINDLRRVASGHKIAINGEFKPVIKFPDLEPEILSSRLIYGIDDTIQVSVGISSKKVDSKDVILSIDMGDNAELIDNQNTIEIGDIKGGQKVERVIKILPTSSGEIKLTIDVDPENTIEEFDEDNNSTETQFTVFDKPQISVELESRILQLQELRYTYQDESVVPLVFFDKNSDDVPDRFMTMLKLLSGRLADNPDMNFDIVGYIDTTSGETGKQLALNRAENVMREMVKFNPHIENQVGTYVSEPTKKRISKFSEREEYQKYINEENRRVEILVEKPDIFYPFDYSAMDKSRLENTIEEAIDYLEKNPMAVLVVRASEKETNLDEALSRAYSLKQEIIRSMPSELSDRVLASSTDEAPPNFMDVGVSGEGILYKPREIHSALNFKPEEPEECLIKNKVDAPAGIKRWEMYLQDEEGDRFWSIASGEGVISKEILWDWCGPQGGLVPFDEEYKVCLEVEDSLGQKSIGCSSDRIDAEIIELEERTDIMLLVQFSFDAPAAQSRYLQDRLEDVARKIIQSGMRENTALVAELQGHTDFIGGERRNLELSRERAETIYERLTAYMQVILNLQPRESLENWLEKNRVEISTQGFADKNPYNIEIWKQGELNNVVIGSNDTPEGRNINRRVIIYIKETKDVGGENE